MKPTTFLTILAAIGTLTWTSFTHADDVGDTFETAQTIQSRDTPASLNTFADVDMFKLIIPQAGRYFIYSTGDADTWMAIYDAAGNRISYDDNSWVNYNFYYSNILKAGTYFLGVEVGGNAETTGDYMLSIRNQRDATPLTGRDTSAALDVCGDIDFYKFEITQAGRTFLYTTGLADTWMGLYDHVGNRISYDNESWVEYNALINRVLQEGTYYILIKEGDNPGSTTHYELSIRTHANAPLLEARDLATSLGTNGQIDFYRLEITQAGLTHLYTTGQMDTWMALYDHAGNRISYDDSSWADYNAMLSLDLQASTHYVYVRHGGEGSPVNDYTLSVRQPSEAMPIFDSDSFEKNLNSFGQIDHFVFTTTGGPVTFFSAGMTDTYCGLYHASGVRLTYDSTSGSGDNFFIQENLLSGAYYLLVRGNRVELDKGPYTLNAQFAAGSMTILSDAFRGIPNAGGSYNLVVDSSTSWSVTGLPAWVNVNPKSGSGTRTVTVSVEPNLSNQPRMGEVVIGGRIHRVSQSSGESAGTGLPMTLSAQRGMIISLPTEPGIQYRIEGTSDFNTWLDTGARLRGDGHVQHFALPMDTVLSNYRAVSN